ncbi:hypothetical protein BD289DRAFT_462175 [Coniella lustricola]|uniref:NADH:ubiquinone oxidoreductase 20.1kD subunit n=1 Tax=Coniella lustricola TaxID=2025994 RepID=A0A2T3A1U5_9PEZI|nr:hypothetical protein BD289DRAFT_462175 [Coniella lustricola]
MLSRRLAARASTLRPVSRLPIVQQRTFVPDWSSKTEEKYPDSDYAGLTEAEDPLMNGGYVQPPPIKRQFRDPHADWWDKQERRNYGEVCHENYDQLGMFTPHAYTWVTPRKGFMQVGVFLAALATVLYAVKLTYPDIPAVPREFEAGLDRELGGAGAIRARAVGDPEPFQDEVDVD